MSINEEEWYRLQKVELVAVLTGNKLAAAKWHSFCTNKKKLIFCTSILPFIFYFRHYSHDITELSVILNSYFASEGIFCYFTWIETRKWVHLCKSINGGCKNLFRKDFSYPIMFFNYPTYYLFCSTYFLICSWSVMLCYFDLLKTGCMWDPYLCNKGNQS